MAISFDLELETEEKKLLCNIIGCEEAELNNSLSLYGKSAIEEYIRMFLGQKVFTRGSDIKEYRLFLLIKSVFKDEIPDEQKVCDLFQMTTSESKSLIKAVMSKYQYELKDAISKTLLDRIISAIYDEVEDYYTVDIRNENLVSELNRILGSVDGSLPPIVKKRGTVTTHIIRPSAYNVLIACDELRNGINERAKKIIETAVPLEDEIGNVKGYTFKTDFPNEVKILKGLYNSSNGDEINIEAINGMLNGFKMTVETHSILNSKIA